MQFRKTPTGWKSWSAHANGIYAEIHMTGDGRYAWRVYEYKSPHHEASGSENSRAYAEIKVDTFYDEHKGHKS